MSAGVMTPFYNEKYLNLETYRKNGQAVRTPVWFVIDDEVIYVTTPSNTGKVKRLTHSKNIRIVP